MNATPEKAKPGGSGRSNLVTGKIKNEKKNCDQEDYKIEETDDKLIGDDLQLKEALEGSEQKVTGPGNEY